ncbi:MAG TPA: hypothetical protein VFU32_11010 [Ktedonobacterales bacterium]|nr:hypothetical protein [Ktedonobacterales bacterium]
MGLTDDDRALLALIHQLKHPTADDLYRHGPSHRPRRYLYRRLVQLEQREMIGWRLLRPEQGARAPRYYHLRLAGARVLGLDGVGSDHYRRPTLEVYHAGQVRRELALVAQRHHWHLLSDEVKARQRLASVLMEAARATYGETFPGYSLLPADLKVHPDLLLDTGQRVILVIVGHPHASAVFWRKRVARYQPVLGAVAAVCFALSEQQYRDAEQAVHASLYAKRFLVLKADQVEELLRRLAPVQ